MWNLELGEVFKENDDEGRNLLGCVFRRCL